MVAKVTQNGVTYVIPGSYVKQNIIPAVPGLTGGGVVGLLGESTSGEQSATDGPLTFAPSQFALIQSTYGSGPLVDAALALAAPSNDAILTGQPTALVLYKTNHTLSASTPVYVTANSYGTFHALASGSAGNSYNVTVETYQAAVQPSVGPFTFIPGGASVSAVLRLSGDAALNFQLGGNASPPNVASSFNVSTSYLLVSGGVNRGSFSGNAGQTLSVTASAGNVVTFGLNAANTFTITPVVGDTIVMPATGNYGSTANSTFSGTSGVNLGAYVVTAVSNNATTALITTVKLSNSSATVGVITPVNTSTTFTAQPNNDLQVYSPLTVQYKVGSNRNSFTAAASTNVSVTVTGSSLRVNFLGSSFAFSQNGTTPQVGDDLYIPSGSAIGGAAAANVGWYAVTSLASVTGSSYIIATRSSLGTAVNVSSTAVTSTPDTSDIIANRPWSNRFVAGLSISDGGAAQGLAAAFFDLGTSTAASFISSAGTPDFVTGTEFIESIETKQASSSVDEVVSNIGGGAALEIGYYGTTASVNVSSTSLTFTVAGGPGANFSVSTSQFSTVGDLVAYINTQPGFAATAANNIQALPLTYTPNNTTTAFCVLDAGTYTLCSSVTSTEYPGQIKMNAYDFNQALAASAYLSFTPAANFAGLAELFGPVFLSGGSQGATSGADIVTALDSFASQPINFVVPLFSQDATTDAAQGVTAIGSTYTIDAINAAVKAHCIAMSTPQNQRNRVGVVSKRATFTNAKLAAESMASSRISFAFQDSKNLNSLGNIVQYQPWMLAVIAAGMQAVGEEEPITGKAPNVASVLDYYGSADFNPSDPALVTEALEAGLLVVQPTTSGGLRWVSDATTYSATSDLIPNSLSSMYLGDLIALDLISSGTSFVVGRPTAIMTQPKVVSFLQQKFSQYLSNLWTSPSQGAPAGYKNLVVTLDNGVYSYAVTVYIDSEVLFLIGNLNLQPPSFS